MDKEIIRTTSEANARTWPQEHLPTVLRAARCVRRRIDAIPILPEPLASFFLAVFGILAALLILWLVVKIFLIHASHD